MRNFSAGAATGIRSRSDRVLGEVAEVVLVAQELVEVSESVLDWRERRRKGMEGRRKVGKRGDVGCGSGGLRRKDIFLMLLVALQEVKN
jgi:hypothetical protein